MTIKELQQQMTAEIRQHIKVVKEGNTTIESIDEEIRKEIESKYLPLIESEKNKIAYIELRAKEYLAKGLTTDKLIVALWEAVIEGRFESAQELQRLREAVKAKYPKT